MTFYNYKYYEKHKVLYSWLTVLLILLVAFVIIYFNNKRIKAESGIQTKAKVIDKFNYSKGSSGMRYKYLVRGKVYINSTVCDISKKIPLGDSIYISYENENPENSIPIFDSLHLIYK